MGAWSEFSGVPGFDGPETHPYAEDMYVHLFAPTREEEATDAADA